jgi:hypothetical protein
MPSAQPTSRRLALLGCVLAGAAALALPGCGDNGAATAENAAAPGAKAKPGAPANAAEAGCPRQLDSFVGSLGALRRQLAVGLSYDQYAAKVRGLRGSYDALPVHRLGLDCVTATGTPAEAALNQYIDGVNAWGDCLADASCTTATIEPVLQRKWRLASRSLTEANGKPNRRN